MDNTFNTTIGEMVFEKLGQASAAGVLPGCIDDVITACCRNYQRPEDVPRGSVR